MKTCQDCPQRTVCRKPCKWLEERLEEVTSKKKYLTKTELNINSGGVFGVGRA